MNRVNGFAEEHGTGTADPDVQGPISSRELARLDWAPNPPGKLTAKQRKFLKGLAHHLKPVVLIGQEGISESVIGEVRQQLLSHELIKVKWSGLSRQEAGKKQQAEQLAEQAGAHYVHLVGRTVFLYREPEPCYLASCETKKIQLPD